MIGESTAQTNKHTITNVWGAGDDADSSFLVSLGLDGHSELFQFLFESTGLSRQFGVAFTRHAGNVVGGTDEDIMLPENIRNAWKDGTGIGVEFNEGGGGRITCLGDRTGWLMDSFLERLPPDNRSDAAESNQPLEHLCDYCEGTGGDDQDGTGWYRCQMCNGAGYKPTEAGEAILMLVRHNLKPMLEDEGQWG